MIRTVENGFIVLLLATIVILPLADMVLRRVSGVGLPGAISIVQHLTLWIALLGAALAAREDRRLTMGTVQLITTEKAKRAARALTSAVAGGVSAMLAVAGLDLVLISREFPGTSGVAGVEEWVAMAVIPVAFAIMAIRIAWRADERWPGRLLAALGLIGGVVLAQAPALAEGLPAWVTAVVMIVTAALGMPIFAAIGGAAALLFLGAGVPLAAVPTEAYEMTTSPALAAIPLFTVAGFILAEGGMAQRLLRLFRAWVGWIPGGTAVVLALIFAFFTVFTGGSGVTILALGGLGYQALKADGYRDRFSLGLLTGSASLGLLLPPALPLILYGIVASVAIQDLFIAGILPGLLLIGLTVGWAVREGVRSEAPRTAWDWQEALSALRAAGWDVLLPVLVLGALFSGYATLIEAAALTAAFAFLLEVVITRDVSLKDDILSALVQAAALIGGVLVILAVAKGLTSFMVDARVTAMAVEWLQTQISSTIVFLLLLNLFLLAVGCMMDIFSAIVVVAPLLIPLGLAYDVDPIHMGIIFIANLEMGYLTPPVGLNLFLASYRFERPYGEIARAGLPMLLIYAVGVGLITYMPWLTTGVLALFQG
jgi:C4-dicarboxylate transporter DctM subunit